jgi:tetratricopeptide (TPR) repeat protein
MGPTNIRGVVLLVVGILMSGTGLAGQEVFGGLPLKRELPPPPPGACDGVELRGPAAADVLEADRREAERLLAEANRAALLGERETTRTLLREAAALNPASAAVVYRLGRILEDTGEDAEAVDAFCRYLALDPGGADAGDASDRVDRLFSGEEDSLPAGARSAFAEGVAAVDGGDLEAAARHFSRALVEHPRWDLAHYNRGVVYLRMGRAGAGVADLEWYLESNPGAPDGDRVRDELVALAPAVERRYSPSTALATGLLVPGMGHFYSGRPGTGFLILATATASAAVGVLHTDVEVRCRSIPVDGECPPGDVLERREDRPFLVPGLAAAAVTTVAGAIHAFRGVRSTETALAGTGNVGQWRGSAMGESGVTPFLSVTPLSPAEGGGARAAFGIRF